MRYRGGCGNLGIYNESLSVSSYFLVSNGGHTNTQNKGKGIRLRALDLRGRGVGRLVECDPGITTCAGIQKVMKSRCGIHH